MKKIFQNIIIILLIIKLLFVIDYCSNKTKKSILLRNLQHSEPPFHDNNKGQPPDREDYLDVQREQLENDYKKKLEENSLLKKQIEEKIKYIKILLTTNIIMFSIILYISIKAIIKCKKKSKSHTQIGKNIFKNEQINNIDNMKNMDNIEKNRDRNNKKSSLNFSIENSSYNIIKSDNKSINNSNELDNNNSLVCEDNEKNYDAPKMANYSNIVINDDNKTLTNNPDVFVPSRMDKILYRPYSNEEINK
jgi:hypothetical protein